MYRIGKEEIEAVARVMYAKDFFKFNSTYHEAICAEEDMRRIFDTKYPLLMTSGHAALVSGLTAMGVGPGDEVIVPAYTYIATAMAVVAVGAIPVIAEIDETMTLCPIDTERKITKHTKAIIPVHIQGFPCNMDALKALSDKYGVKILEDACQADGAEYHGKKLGTVGDAGVLSFNFFKVISAGEGGALFTDDKSIYERALIYHDSNGVAFFGDQLSTVDQTVFCGNEYRTNDITAAILRVQLTRLDGIVADLRKNKREIMRLLGDSCSFVPSNDSEGDLGSTFGIRFESAEKADAFVIAHGSCRRPINTGKHVYSNWTPIMNKVGALNPLMDPYKMEANKDIIPDYKPDMCPKSLDLMSRTVLFSINPDWTAEECASAAEKIKNTLANI